MDSQELEYRVRSLYWDICSTESGSLRHPLLMDKDHKFLRELGARLTLGMPKGTRKGFSVVKTSFIGDIEAYRKGIRIRNARPAADGCYPIFLEFPTKRAERMILLGWEP